MSVNGKLSIGLISFTVAVVSLLLIQIPIVSGGMDGSFTRSSMNEPLDISSIYWPMIGRNPYHTSEGVSSPRGLMDPVVTWSGNTTSLGSVSADLSLNTIFNETDPVEVFGIIESNNTHVRIHDGETGESIWEMDVRMVEGRATNRLRAAPAISDIDSDGKVEIVVYIWDVNEFQIGVFEPVVNRNSTEYTWSLSNYFDERIWLSILLPTTPDIESSPILFDISDDGVEDVIVGSSNILYSFYGNNGTLMWFLEIGSIGESLSTPAIFPGAGATRRIVVNSILPSQQNMRTTLVNFDGDHLMNISVGLGLTFPYLYQGRITIPVIGDVTGDGEPEIILSYPSRRGEGRVVIYSYILGEIARISSVQGYLESTPSMADVDGDGDHEIFLHSRYTTTNPWINMSCYDIIPQSSDFVSDVLWQRDGTTTGGTLSLYTSPLICDLDEDNAPDVVFFANGWVHTFSFAGVLLWSLPVTDTQLDPQGCIGDLGRDNFTDLYFDGMMISQKVVDLTIKEPADMNIYTGSEPVDGLPVRLHGVIENLGTSPASDVTIMFEDTPPGGSKALIGYTTMDEIVTTSEASIDWVPVGVGTHRIDLTIDPNSTVIETDESNNENWVEIDVRMAIPDLVIHDIKFLRGDGLIIEGENSEKRLVEMDPSTILVQVGNIGEGLSDGGLVNVLVNSTSPGAQAEDVPIDQVAPGSFVNVSVPWTPEELPDGVDDETYNVTADIDTDTQGLEEISKFNNDGYNITIVKSNAPVGGFEISGTVYNSQSQTEPQTRVTATNERTQSSLEDETNFQGDYSIYFPLTDYLDGDQVSMYGKKTTSWAQNSTRIYSEDGSTTVDLTLTDVPTLTLAMIPDGQLEYEVLPRVEYNLRFWVENTGNIPGDFSLEKTLQGNTSLTGSLILVTPSDFTLDAGEQREVAVKFTIPSEEEPGRVAVLTIDGTLVGNGTDSDSLIYTFTVGRSGAVYYEFDSEKNVTLNVNKENQATFRVYVLNQGNVPVEYNLSVSEGLLPYSQVLRGEGELDPSDSMQVEITVTLLGDEDKLIGEIVLRTSGAPARVSWDVKIELEYPNLEADDLIRVTDESMELGDRITLLGTVRNIGRVEAEDILCSFYEGDTLIGSSTLSYLGPGEEATPDGVDWEPTGVGVREIFFKIDPNNDILEDDDDDNEAARTFSFYPDLSISSVGFEPTVVTTGESVKATVTVKNLGNAKIDRGFKLNIRSGGNQGDLLATQDYDRDVPTGGINTVQVELLFTASEEAGKMDVWIGVTLLSGEEVKMDNNEYSNQIDVESPPGKEKDYTIFIIIVVGAVVFILGAALYIWKFGPSISPPPGGEEEPIPEEGPQVESVPPEIEVDEGAIEEEPVLEMHLESPEETPVPMEEPMEEEVIVAEIVEIEEEIIEPPLPPEPKPPEPSLDADEEGLIPEV